VALVEATSGRTRWASPALDAVVVKGDVDVGAGTVLLVLRNGVVVTLDLEEGHVVATRELAGVTAESDLRGAEFAPDRSRVVLMLEQPAVHDVATGERICVFEPSEIRVTNPQWSPNGERISVTHGGMGFFTVHDAATGKRDVELRGHQGFALDSTWHPTRPWIATSARDGSLRLWDAQDGRALAISTNFPMTGRVVQFNHDGRVLVFNSSSVFLLRVGDEGTLDEFARFETADDLRRLVFAPDAPAFFTYDRAGGIRRWLLDPVSQGKGARVQGRSSPVTDLLPTAPAPTKPHVYPLHALERAQDLAAVGKEQEAHAILDQVAAARPAWSHVAATRAAIHARAGRTAEALDALEQAMRQGFARLLGGQRLAHDARFESLRTHPRFEAILNAIERR